MKRVKQDSAKLAFIVGSEPTHTLFSQNSPQHLLVVAAPMCRTGSLSFQPIYLSLSATQRLLSHHKYTTMFVNSHHFPFSFSSSHKTLNLIVTSAIG